MPGVEPNKLLLRRADVIAWTGITLSDFKKLVKAKAITGKPLHKGGKCYYGKEHIRAVLVKPYEI